MELNKSIIISTYCQNAYFPSKDSDKLLIFLPSVNGKDVYPYYPRLSWAKELSEKYHVLYISDPYQPLEGYIEPMGSWFVSPEGKLTLIDLANKLKVFINDISVNEVIFYGSSMGGYAAVILSSFLENSKAISECPQLYLDQHPGSRFICENILAKNINKSEIEPLSFLKICESQNITIVCSIYDRHYEKHILPFIDEIRNGEYSKLKLRTVLYSLPEYKKGHVALQKKEAFKLIDDVASYPT